MSNNALNIINDEINYYQTCAHTHRQSLSALLAISIGALATFIIQLQNNYLNFDNAWYTILFFVGLNWIFYGILLLFRWYDVHNFRREIEQVIHEKKFEDLIGSFFDAAPHTLLHKIVQLLITILSITIIIHIIFSTSAFTNVIIFIIISIIFISINIVKTKIKKLIINNSLNGYKQTPNVSQSFNYMKNNLIYYILVFGCIVIGISMLIFLNADNKLNLIIIALYILILQIILINSLDIYSNFSKCKHEILRLHDLKLEFIEGAFENNPYLLEKYLENRDKTAN